MKKTIKNVGSYNGSAHARYGGNSERLSLSKSISGDSAEMHCDETGWCQRGDSKSL